MSRYLIPALLLLVVAGPAAVAAETFEIGAFYGYRFGDDFDAADGVDPELEEDSSYGLVLEIPVYTGTYVELLFSHQETEMLQDDLFPSPRLFDVEIDYYHVGGHWVWQRKDVVRPFVSLTGGLTELNAQGARLESESRPSFSLGGGSKFMVAEHAGFRLEARVYGTYFDGSGDILCGSGVCTARVNGSFFWQVEASAGFLIKF